MGVVADVGKEEANKKMVQAAIDTLVASIFCIIMQQHLVKKAPAKMMM